MSAPPTLVRFGRWIVTCLVLWISLDVGGRLLPVGWLHMVPEHEASRWIPPHAPFEPNLSILEDHWIGETALKGNLAPTEFRPPLRFSTDSLGFRLTEGVSAQDPIDFLLAGGASFAYGGGLSDDETLPSVFTKSTGWKMYNGEPVLWNRQSVPELDRLLARLGNRHPAVVVLHWEQFQRSRAELDPPRGRIQSIGEKLLGPDRFRPIGDRLQFFKDAVSVWWEISPLEVLSIRLIKSIHNDRLLPNRYKETIVERVIPTGQRILFLDEEFANGATPQRDARLLQTVDYFTRYRDLLALRQCDFYVVLIPNKYTLYGPLLDAPAASAAEPYLNRLENELRKRNISVVNGLSALSPLAASDLASGNLSFYREDHHWSPLGVRRISEALAREVKLRQEAKAGHAIQ